MKEQISDTDKNNDNGNYKDKHTDKSEADGSRDMECNA